MTSTNPEFNRVWLDAVEAYQRTSGVNTKAIQLPPINNLELFRQEIENHQSKFAEYRNARRSLWGTLSAILKPVEFLGSLVTDGASMGARDVSHAYDYLQDLFDDIKGILARLQVHTKKQLSGDLSAIFVEILSCILEIFGVSTKYINGGRAKRFFKKTFGADEDATSTLKEKLKKLVDEENSKVNNLADTIENLSKQLKAANPSSEDLQKPLETIKTKLQPQTGVEDDLSLLKCMKGTGEWVINDSQVQKWIDGELTLLRLSGGPGTGKSHLSSFIVTHLLEKQTSNPIQSAGLPVQTKVGYFFFKENDPLRTDFAIALRTMSYQIAQKDSAYLNYVVQASSDPNNVSSLVRVWRMLFQMFLTPQLDGRFYLIFDGIDEANREDLLHFLSLLRDIQGHQNFTQMSILLVGRPEMEWYFEEVFYEDPVPYIDISARRNQDDIKHYIGQMLGRYRNLKKISKGLRQEIIDTLGSRADSMFLWVDLMLKEISTKTRESAIRASLQQLPKGLPATYQKMFQSITELLVDEPDQIKDLKEMLMWVGFALRPLNMMELEHISALRYGDDESGLLDLEGHLGKKYASLFTVVRESHFQLWNFSGTVGGEQGQVLDEFQGDSQDEDPIPEEDDDEDYMATYQKLDRIVRLRHASLGDFLKLGNSDNSLSFTVDDANLHLLKTCFRVMLDPTQMPSSYTQYSLPKEVLAETPRLAFAPYATTNWYLHLQKVQTRSTKDEDKAYIINSLYEILTNIDIVATQIRNPPKGIILNACRAFIDGTWTDTVTLWLKEEAGLSLSFYRVVLEGKVDPVTYSADRETVKFTDCEFEAKTKFDIFRGVDIKDVLYIWDWPNLEKNAFWYANAGSTLLDAYHYESAIEYFNRALEMGIESDEVISLIQVRISDAYCRKKEYDMGISILEALFSRKKKENVRLEDLDYVFLRPWAFGRKEAAKNMMIVGGHKRDHVSKTQTREEVLDQYIFPAILFDTLEVAKAYADQTMVGYVELNIASFYHEYANEPEKAIPYWEKFLDKCAFEPPVGAVVANSQISQYAIGWCVVPLGSIYRLKYLHPDTTTDMKTEYLQKIEKLDKLDQLYQLFQIDMSSDSIYNIAFLGAINRKTGNEEVAQGPSHRPFGWESLIHTACSNGDEINLKWAMWACFNDRIGEDSDYGEYGLKNEHGRQWSTRFGRAAFRCSQCNTKIPMAGQEPISFCQYTFHAFCIKCMEKIKADDPDIYTCHSSHLWLEFNGSYFPEPKENESMSDEEEISWILDRFKKQYL
ncbi:hypothetical protein H072_10431 [Dactylellina haptotyla CBS 200.50]|uniref:NACHT domain-containing protein n=1 Tax=Dactylellina haptotyla (strain CBS 200.50) TaxID=1284197 RepID=S8BLB1_DACHA|nr:hypothetical protein H072_10431 [Dactylellina haptotyla CBS 200.50]